MPTTDLCAAVARRLKAAEVAAAEDDEVRMEEVCPEEGEEEVEEGPFGDEEDE